MVCKKWSDNEIENILQDIKDYPISEINSKYQRSSEAIYSKLKSLKVDFSNINYSDWTKDQEEWLKENYNKYPNEKLINFLKKDLCDIRLKSTHLNLGRKNSNPKNMRKKSSKYVKPHEWTKDEENYLIKNFQLLSFQEMEETLKLSRRAIYSKADKLGLKRDNIRIKKDSFTIYEIETLKTYYGNLPIKELLKLLPRKNEDQINRKAKSLKLHKIKQTLPEEKVEKILKELNVSYKQQVRFTFNSKYYLCDFKVNDKFIIEVQGDYWHGNPKLYDEKSLNNLQRDMMKRDFEKKEELVRIGYEIIYIWEYDLIHDFDYCKQQLSLLLQ